MRQVCVKFIANTFLYHRLCLVATNELRQRIFLHRASAVIQELEHFRDVLVLIYNETLHLGHLSHGAGA